MEQFARRISTVLVIAQHGPHSVKPFFAIVSVTSTREEFESGFHHQVARAVLVEHGCKPALIVCCDIEDAPAILMQGLVQQPPVSSGALVVFTAEPRHFDQARQFANAN